MDNATLTRIAILPPEARAAAIEDLVELLVDRGLTEAELDRLERQVHQVNATLAQRSRLH
ncbi:MAG TPA: hypothetical protein VLI41_12450 [Phenylobacterium sp.]|uniref:hypothetical protein n=1 Tax=Phenylobacterium sp. TaxID=1871053 RepID=UPI002D120C34|nr:hypothetical protein [Phenylobacterium sp.]HSV04005.1 hypothetical protein [Phenylobacterium sp.]